MSLMDAILVLCAIVSALWTAKPWRAISWTKKRWHRWRANDELVDYEYDPLTEIYLGLSRNRKEKGK